MILTSDYKGWTYSIITFGTHPCAYVDVKDTMFDGKFYADIPIECHGGLTYSAD